jgi:hypothetical protein
MASNLHCTHFKSYTGKGEVHVFLLTNHFIFLFGLRCIILCIKHEFGLPPSFSFQIDSLHLWLISKFNGDPFSPLLLWIRNELHPMMLFEAFTCIMIRVSCFVWTNSMECDKRFYIALKVHLVMKWWHFIFKFSKLILQVL